MKLVAVTFAKQMTVTYFCLGGVSERDFETGRALYF